MTSRLFIFIGIAAGFSVAADAASNSSQPQSDTFTVSDSTLKVCGRTVSVLRPRSSNADLVLHYKTVALGKGLYGRIPDHWVAFNGGAGAIVRDSSTPATIQTKNPLLLLPIPAAIEGSSTYSRFCDQVDNYFKTAQATSIHASSSLLSVKLDARAMATVSVASSISAAALVRKSASPQTFSAPPLGQGGIQHVVLYYSAAYAQLAQNLSGYRNSQGITSIAQDIASLPGMTSFTGSSVPSGCEGDYYQECFIDLAEAPSGVGPKAIPLLYGMARPGDLTSSFTRVPDVAGLMRAYLRTLKNDNPTLKYVVLLGDPQSVPVRFASGLDMGAPISPVDFYFRELTTVWARSSTITSAIFLNWRWQLYPLRLSLPDVSVFSLPDLSSINSQNVLSVGRITTKRGIIDASNVLTKIAAWEKNPQKLCNSIAVSGSKDGGGDYGAGFPNISDLKLTESALGGFRLYGEGFGTAWKSPGDSACAPTRDWHSATSACGYWDLNDYQNSNEVKADPSSTAANPLGLPSPMDFVTDIQNNGYNFFRLEGHGAAWGILTTWGRLLITPEEAVFFKGLGPDAIFLPEKNGKTTGFVSANSCDPAHFMDLGEYVDATTDGVITSKNLRVLAEGALTEPTSGAVGVMMNFNSGFGGDEESFDDYFYDAVKTLGSSKNARIGDALNQQVEGLYSAADTYLSYQLLNRFFFGDPATLMTGGVCPIESLPFSSTTDLMRGI